MFPPRGFPHAYCVREASGASSDPVKGTGVDVSLTESYAARRWPRASPSSAASRAASYGAWTFTSLSK